MYREPLATNKPKQKSPSQADPLAPARSAVQRRRSGRPSSHASRPEPGRLFNLDERRRYESLHRERLNAAPSTLDRLSDIDSLLSFVETELSPTSEEDLERFNRGNDFGLLAHLRDVTSTPEADSILPEDNSRSMSLSHISTYPNISSNVSGGLPASLDRAGESFAPMSREAQRQIRLITQMARQNYRRRHLTREEVDGLGDRRRSPTPEDYSWETLRTTITPDERLPSVHSSFTSTDALSTSDPTPHTAIPTNRNRAVCTILSIHSFIEESTSEEESDTS